MCFSFPSTAVRAGNLPKFNETLAKFGPKFQAEDTYTLIIRLRHNVIKTGVRMISLSYSRISLSDIAQKLTLDSPEDAEFIVAKVSNACFLIFLVIYYNYLLFSYFNLNASEFKLKNITCLELFSFLL